MAPIVRLACLLPPACVLVSSHGGLDDFALVQRSFLKGQKANTTVNMELPVLSYVVGESAEVKGSGQFAGKWFPCLIKSKREQPETYTITVPDMGDVHHVPASHLRKADLQAANWLPSFAAGERAEMLATEGSFKGSWIQSKVLSQGSMPNTYHVEVPTSKVGPIPDVQLSHLRKLGEPMVAGCSRLDRRQALHMFKKLDVFVFAGWANKCENFLLGNAVDYQKLDRCVREVMPVSPMCSMCGIDFAREAMGPCSAKCVPVVAECGSFTSPSRGCMEAATGCMECTTPAMNALFECLGMYYEGTPGQLELIVNTTRKGYMALTGMADGIFGAILNGLYRSVL
mmetsp:Transcript_100840/g.315134  ORF Transcript_100840/g.315134 Transcript_100840/m.315134 type:complete len:342 (-) Transcript_100840:60-1085(-)